MRTTARYRPRRLCTYPATPQRSWFRLGNTTRDVPSRVELIALGDAVFLFDCSFDALPEVVFRLLIGE
jgi:hypothetical protein